MGAGLAPTSKRETIKLLLIGSGRKPRFALEIFIMSLINHPAIATYQSKLEFLKGKGHVTETQTRAAFRSLLEKISEERGYYFVEEFPVGKNGKRKVDGAVQDEYSSLGYWEAKDDKDDLDNEIKKKIAAGYPVSNIIFEDTKQAVLWQNKKEIERYDLKQGEQVARLLEKFFGHTEADREGFEVAVRDFITKIPELAGALKKKIDGESENARFKKAFGNFFVTCQTALNPQIKESAVKEMLIQHLLTERLFRVVFANPEWVARNVIAGEIESVIGALTSKSWSRAEFLKSLDPFYNAIEKRAQSLDYGEKQTFLNNVYERFFQGYSTETADTMGIVYTPQEIVDWMCASVQRVLQIEFGKQLETPGVKILDPCVGTGNFLVNILGRIPTHALPQKYKEDLFANEIMLLPYYVASGNIEHEYFERLGEYQAFEGLCFADTLDLFQGDQVAMFAEENTERIARQKSAELTVIIGNPPYNVGQKNENDNNKNRDYNAKRKGEKGVDDLIRESYAKASKATNKNKIYDPYVRFFKWAEHRLKDNDGMVCFVSNNSFVDQHAFDGMRKHLGDDFNHIWHLDLHGNVRKNPKLSGTTHNVFGIQVGVGITILVKNSASQERFIRYHRVTEDWRKTEKLKWLADKVDLDGIEWQTLTPNAKNAWLTEGLEDDFDTFVPLGNKEAKASFSGNHKTVFRLYSNGIQTNRDDWVFDFDQSRLIKDVRQFIEFYNREIARWESYKNKNDNFDDFVSNDDTQIKWSSTLKDRAKRGQTADFSEDKIRTSLYRPFCKQKLYFDPILVHRPANFQKVLPTADTENRLICLSGIGHDVFVVLMTDCIPELKTANPTNGGTQCFPLYTYSADGRERFDNVTGYALDEARRLYGSEVSRENIFYASYALLHHPAYRAKYAENLKRELPRIPLDLGKAVLPSLREGPGEGKDGGDAVVNPHPTSPSGGGVMPTAHSWQRLVDIGRALGDLHVGYENAPLYPLSLTDTTPEGKKFSFRVEKMKWADGKSQLIVNDSITLRGFTPEMFEYKLGNRSALDWVVECYRVKTDARSGLVSDPNREDEPKFILDLIAKVATVSLETQKLVNDLPPLFA